MLYAYVQDWVYFLVNRFVFIELESKEEVDEMIKTRQGEKLEGNELSIGRYIPKKKNRALTKKQNGGMYIHYTEQRSIVFLSS